MKENDFSNIVVLIDSENISPNYIKEIFEIVAKYGNISVKRIYGDWSKDKGWKEVLQENSLIPIQQFNNVGSKNVSDFTLVIDAMDLVHEGIFDCFCLVSSDSDFTRLAQRIREKGKYVIGLGEIKTTKAFVKSCNTFHYLNEENKIIINIKDKNTETKEFENSSLSSITSALTILQDNEGWVELSQVVPYIKRIQPEFELSQIGVKKLSDYFTEDKYEIRKENSKGPGPVFVKKK